MTEVIAYVILYSLVTSFSIMLMGDRNLISGNLFEIKNALHLIFHWKFLLAMTLAIGSRVLHVFLNSALLKIPHLAKNSTTISAFILLISFVFMIGVNYIFLNEQLNFKQFIGAGLILLGVGIMLK